ncbi:MAG: hypothetical protein R3Y58_10755 [Eubacteriales bacterium]
MVKIFFRKYGVELLEGYLAAMACYLCMYTADWNIWVTAIIIGFVNSYLKTPVVNALHIGNADKDDIFGIKHNKVIKNIFEALVICGIIYGMYYLVNLVLFATSVEPITFGVLYELIHIGISKIMKKWK